MPKLNVLSIDRFELSILGISVVLALVFLILPESSVLAWFTTDDAFYYFVTARNISSGMGSTFDGIALTNGYHPLWMLICIPVFALVRIDLLLPLRIVIVIQMVLSALSGILLYRLTRKYITVPAAYIVTFIWLFLPSIHSSVLLGGVESALNGVMIIAVLACLDWALSEDISDRSQKRRFAILGMLAGLGILARLDNAFLIAGVGLWATFQPLLANRKIIHARRAAYQHFSRVVFFFIPVIAIFGVYALWNLTIFGSIMPISGAVKHWWGAISGDPYGAPPASLRQLYLETFASTDKALVPFWLPYSFGQSLANPVNRILGLFGMPALVKTIYILLGLGAITLLNRHFTLKAILRLSIIPLVLGSFAQVVYYKIGGSVATRPWYWVSETILFVLLFGIFLGVLVQRMLRYNSGKLLSSGLVVICISMITVQFVSYFQRNFLAVREEKPPYLLAAEFLEHETEKDATIGIVASGSIAYFIQDRTIVNLDGLSNGFEYFEALKKDEAATYLKKIGTDYIYGSGHTLFELPPYAANFKDQLIPAVSDHLELDEPILWKLVD